MEPESDVGLHLERLVGPYAVHHLRVGIIHKVRLKIQSHSIAELVFHTQAGID